MASRDNSRAAALHNRFYGGGGIRRIDVIGTSGIAAPNPPHEFRPGHYPELGLRMPNERRLLSQDERDLAAHYARRTVAAEVFDRRRRDEEVIRRMTCEVCDLRSDVIRLTIKVAGADPLSRRCCSECESALTLELRRRVAARELPTGKTRMEAAAESLDGEPG